MSYSFSLSGIEALNYTNTINAINTDNLVLIENTQLKEDGLWPKGYTHIYIDNTSTRPLEFEYDGNNLNIRILTSSSPADYELATKLTEAIAGKYNTDISPEDAERVSHQDFLLKYNKDWCKEHAYETIDMLLAMIEAEQKTIGISCINSKFEAGPRVLEQIQKSDNKHEEFLRRIVLLNFPENNNIFVSSTLALQNNENSKEVKFASLGEGVSSLISTDTDVIILCSNSHEKVIIPTDALLGLIEKDIIWISENSFYIDGISGENWKTLFIQAKNHHLEDIFAAGTALTGEEKNAPDDNGVINSFKERFSDDEWKKLTYSPFLSFFLVSLADGSIDKKELKSFVKSLSNQENPLMIELLNSCHAPASEIMSHFVKLGEEVSTLLQEIGEILDSKLPKNYALAFKVELFKIGKSVAEASGGFFGFGKKISKQEESALVAIATMLKIA